MENIDQRLKELKRNYNSNVVIRKNRDNPTYIDCVNKLLNYFKLGGFHISEHKNYGYFIYCEIKDKNAEYCNEDLISIDERCIRIKRYKGKDNNNCNTFEPWKMLCNCQFTSEHKDFELAQIKCYIHFENCWPEIAKKKIAIADKKIDIEKDFENG